VQQMTFSQTQAVLKALEFAVAKGGFGNNAKLKKTAQSLMKDMKSNDSLSGRHEKLMGLLRRGASIGEMIKATTSSRRTIFRYLNHFEDAGLDIKLVDGKYRLTG